MNKLIRKANPHDAEAIWEVLQHAPFLDVRYRDEKMQDKIEQNYERFWVVEDEVGQIVSTMMVCRVDTDKSGRNWLKLIVTRPEYRRRGFARLLLREAIKLAHADGAELFAYPENECSCALFRSEGFLLVPDSVDFEGNPKYQLLPN